MDKVSVADVLFTSFNQNITLIGKLWLTVFLLFRVFILLFAGFPLFWDEGERFMCNTIHPGCANMCYDAFAPLSLCRFGFLHLVCVCLPTVLYIIHHTHRVLAALTRLYFVQEHQLQRPTLKETNMNGVPGGGPVGLYMLQIILHVFLELAFGAGQYFLFGVSVRREFLCLRAPCSPAVECFTSKPTEKTFLLQWMLGNIVLSVILSTAELLLVLRPSVREKRDGNRQNKEVVAEKSKEVVKGGNREKGYFISNGANSSSSPFPIRKRKPDDEPPLASWMTPKSSLPPWRKAVHIPSHSSSHTSPSPEHSKDNKALLRSAGQIQLWNGHCEKNGSVKDLLPVTLTLNPENVEEWCPTPMRTWRAGQYTPASTTTEHTSDSGESHDNKAWV